MWKRAVGGRQIEMSWNEAAGWKKASKRDTWEHCENTFRIIFILLFLILIAWRYVTAMLTFRLKKKTENKLTLKSDLMPAVPALNCFSTSSRSVSLFSRARIAAGGYFVDIFSSFLKLTRLIQQSPMNNEMMGFYCLFRELIACDSHSSSCFSEAVLWL